MTLNTYFEMIYAKITPKKSQVCFMPHRNMLCVCLSVISCALLIPFYCFGAQSNENQSIRETPPDLIESIRFKEDIRFCNIPVPLQNQDVKQRLEKELLLALWDRPQVILWMKRASKFFPHVEKIIKQYNLPLDLKYIPLIESALRPHASSSKGAVGYWQFLKSTGKNYGLRIDSMVDERRNIFKSTHAACRYLKDLNKEFDSYLLALCAYNMGEYGLKEEIKAQNAKDFFSLYLPLETQRYAFKAVAAKLILENPENYGFYLNPSDLYPVFSFDKVNFHSDFQIPITLIARSAGVPFKTIKDFNPHLRGYYIGKGSMSVLIPKGKAKGFKKSFTGLYKKWEKTDRKKIHIVKRGESLIGIAKIYQMPLSSLLKLNNLSTKRMIHPGDKLFVD